MTPADQQPDPPSRVRLPRDERRAMLLRAALETFSEHGYHATAMDDIAERAGVSKPVLYQHFDSKLELYVALAERVRDDIVETVRAALASTSDNDARIAATMAAFFEFVDRPASGYPLVFASDMGREPAVATIIEEARRGCAEAIGQVIQEESDLGGDESQLLAVAITSQVQAVAQHWVESGSPLPRERAMELLMELVWRGIGHVPQSTPVDGATAGSGRVGDAG